MDNEIEQIVQALLNGESISELLKDFKPKSRTETYLKSALMKTKIEDLPNPQTRLDVLLMLLNDTIHKEYSTKFNEGYSDGHDAGLEDGRSEGYNDGLDIGRAEGYESGYNKGNSDGYESGYDEGNAAGYQTGHTEGYEEGRNSITYQEKEVTPAATNQDITPDEGYDALAKVTVNGDENLKAANIREGTSIFGVEGTLKDRLAFSKGLLTSQLTSITEKDFEGMFTVDTSLRAYCLSYLTVLKTATFPPHILLSAGASMLSCSNLQTVTFKGDTTIGNVCFQNDSKLHTVTFEKDLTFMSNNHFLACTELQNLIIGGQVYYSRTTKTMTVGLRDSTKLTVESMLNLFNASEDLTGTEMNVTINLGSTNLAKLTDEQKAIVLNKNINLT